MTFGQFDGRTAGGQADARDQDMGQAGQSGAFQYGRAVGVENFQIEMAVRVGEYHMSRVMVHVSDCPASNATVIEDT